MFMTIAVTRDTVAVRALSTLFNQSVVESRVTSVQPHFLT